MSAPLIEHDSDDGTGALALCLAALYGFALGAALTAWILL